MGNGIITLITDFGNHDAYAGVMKGVILGINPGVRIVDISHEVAPQDVEEAAWLLSTAWPFFPSGTIHAVVVDPGVGSERGIIIVRTPRALFVAPDNGVLSHITGESMEMISVTRPELWREKVSHTFHGRDIFAPVAGRLSLGVPCGDFGEPVSSIVELPRFRPEVMADGTVIGRVMHVDRFGNLITNLGDEYLPPQGFRIEVKGQIIERLSTSYAAGKGILAIMGSGDTIEVSIGGGSAAEALGARRGDPVKIEPVSG